MLLDIVYAVILLLAILKGYQRGLIVGIFSLLAVIIGLAAAMKLSVVVAGYIDKAVKVSEEWLPVIAFVAVFLLVIILIRLGANAIEKAIEVALLGWLNKLAGILLYAAIYTIIFSVLLFYAEQLKFLKPVTIEQSVTYSFIQPWGPAVINALGSILPFFKNMFD
ncbi:MAG TPA: CvpA family protein, partial [Chitinophagaceae bacterium]|nr:CvpA family protein [Chitinophagaceae bacterium]